MSIKPVTFNPDGSALVVHDDPADGIAHGGITTPTFGTDHRVAIVACPFPGCGSVSYHPVGGGAAPREVQEMFVRMIAQQGCPCGDIPAGHPIEAVKEHVKAEVEAMDGPDRWQGDHIK